MRLQELYRRIGLLIENGHGNKKVIIDNCRITGLRVLDKKCVELFINYYTRNVEEE